MKNLKNEEKKYCESLQKFIQNSTTLEDVFANYFGKEYFDFFQKRKESAIFHVYKPRKTQNEFYIQQMNSYSDLFKTIFIRYFLKYFSIDISETEILNLLKSYQTGHEKRDFLYKIFGENFLENFDVASYCDIPLVNFKKLPFSKQMELLKVLYGNLIPYPELQMYFSTLKANESYLFKLIEKHQLIKYMSNCYKTLDAKEHRELLYSFPLEQKIKFDKISEDIILNKSSFKDSDGFCFIIGGESHIFLSLYFPLNGLVHELGHAYLEERFCKLEDDSILALQGVFNSDIVEELKALEVFNDYFIFNIINSLSFNQREDWPYDIYRSSQYSILFFLVEDFMSVFGNLMKYAMMSRKTKLIPLVVGQENFKEYLQFFGEFANKKVISDEDKNRVHVLIEKMQEHAKNYNVNYLEEVNSYIKEVEQSGKKVRVLKQGMDELMKDEDMVRKTIDTL